MRARTGLLTTLVLIPFVLLMPAFAANPSSAAGPDAPAPVAGQQNADGGLPTEVAVPRSEAGDTPKVIFNDSAATEQPGISPGGPATPLRHAKVAEGRAYAAEEASGALPDPEVLGFAQTGEVTSGHWQSDLNFNLLSTIAYDSINLNSDGTLISSDSGYQGWWSGQMTDLMNTAHSAGDRVVLVITDFSSSSIQSIVSSPTYTQNAVSAVVGQVTARGADGVNVDFEGTTPTVSASDFTSFIAQLRSALNSQAPTQSYLTVDTYASAYQSGDMMDISALSPYVDAFDVMEYDITNPCSSNAGPNAPMNDYPYSVTQVMSSYLRLVPNWQIILGVPYYGYKWSVTAPTGQAPTTNCAEADTWSGILSDFSCAEQSTIHWNANFDEPWATWYSPSTNDPCGGDWGSWRELYYDDPSALSNKYALVNDLGLRGIGIWALGYDSGSNDLWDEIAASFSVEHGNPGPPSAPDISSMSPSVGPTSGGSTVTVNGSDFASGLVLTFNGTALPASNLTPISFTFTTPAGTAGTVSMSVSDTWGTSATISYIYVNPSRYQPVTPFRLLDTRSSSCVNCAGGPLGPGGVVTLTLAGYRDPGSGQTIPATGVTAVVLNLAAVSPTVGTALSVNPTGTAGPSTSTLNAPAQQNVANLVIAPLGNAGRVDIWNSLGTVNVVADVVGYYTSTSGSAGLYHPLAPAVRVCDTRGGQGTACNNGTNNPIGAGQARLVRVADGSTGVVTGGDAEAVALNLTAISPTASTYLSVYPPNPSTHACSGTTPATSTLNVPAAINQANRVVTAVDPTDGSICVYNSVGSVDVAIDVNGWFGNGSDAGGLLFHPIGPSRICDTRPTQLPFAPLPCAGETLTPGGTLTVQVGGAGGLPGSGIAALAANLTAVSGTSATYLAGEPHGVAGSTSDLNVDAQQNLANLVTVTVPSDQMIDIYNSLGNIDAIVDAEGWFG